MEFDAVFAALRTIGESSPHAVIPSAVRDIVAWMVQDEAYHAQSMACFIPCGPPTSYLSMAHRRRHAAFNESESQLPEPKHSLVFALPLIGLSASARLRAACTETLATARRMSTQLPSTLGSYRQSAGRYIPCPLPSPRSISTRTPASIHRSSSPSSDLRSRRHFMSRCCSCSLHLSTHQPT
jgi:hypothetical protein